MQTTLDVLQAEIMRLSPSERAMLFDRLIVCLDADAKLEAAWDELADKRESDLRTGKVNAVAAEEVIARLEARFSR